jgi:hypothetical protein
MLTGFFFFGVQYCIRPSSINRTRNCPTLLRAASLRSCKYITPLFPSSVLGVVGNVDFLEDRSIESLVSWPVKHLVQNRFANTQPQLTVLVCTLPWWFHLDVQVLPYPPASHLKGDAWKYPGWNPSEFGLNSVLGSSRERRIHWMEIVFPMEALKCRQ